MLSTDPLRLGPVNPREGLAHTLYARTAKELNGFIKSIRAQGAQSDLNLPRVAVIGSQSAGKSSLVEAISEIKVPRDAGTCTRCPMELRLSSAASDEPWSCQISIRWDRLWKIGPVVEAPFGIPLTSPDDVELMLRRAQAAVLNPHIGLEQFLTKDAEELETLVKSAKQRFSPNVVCVDLVGPGLPDLSFVDLPGLIQNDEGNGDVQLVENLVRSYISSSNTVILLTLPMTDDLQNQKAGLLARFVDPYGSRTIGVVTKPDAVPDGSLGKINTYLDVVEGKIQQTKLGHYIVRLPDDADRRDGITHVDARAAEAKFFAEHKPWATSTHRHRFGIENLVRGVSEPLTERIRSDIPRIQRDVIAQRTDCNKELDALPPKTTEPQSHVYRLTNVFVDSVRQAIEGSPSHTKLVQSTKQSYTQLAEAIRDTAPPFAPHTRIESVKGINMFVRTKGEMIHLDKVKETIQACLTRELPNNIPYSVKRSFIKNFQSTWELCVTACFDEVEGAFKRTLIELVEAQFGCFKNLQRAVSAIVLDLVDAHAAIAKQQQKFILKYESNPPATQNMDDLAMLRANWLEEYKTARAMGPIASDISAPQSQAQSLFSFGEHASRAIYAIRSAELTSPPHLMTICPRETNLPERQPMFIQAPTGRTTPAKPTRDRATSSTLTPVAAPTPMSTFKPTAATTTPDTPSSSTPVTPVVDAYEDELTLMAEIRAYFDISSKRLIDYIPQAIDEHLLYAFGEALLETLVEKLGLTIEDAGARCARYLAEDPDIAARREVLLAKKQRLDKVHKELYNLGL
ncbi:hypothetical protein GY45DRAFT_1262750 [Cubamyces sp. BRFM 1775]|nr:hypothetical protein GY45DRAFT_1262750 [Cubamyces sp. BRFM 1775]